MFLVGFIAGGNYQEEPIPGPSNQYDVDTPIGQTNRSEEMIGDFFDYPDVLKSEFCFILYVIKKNNYPNSYFFLFRMLE